MFFTQYVLSKKGPLAKIWLAAHWEKKLTKAQVYETNIDRAIESILDPKVKMALRTTGHLLLGIVKIHSRKTKYLLADCNEAFLKIKMAFRPGMKSIDLIDDRNDTDTLDMNTSEVFRDLDSALPDLGISSIPDELAAVQGRYEQITMKENVPISAIQIEDDFGESSALDSFELPREANTSHFDFVSTSRISLDERRIDGNVLNMGSPLLDDGFGGHLTATGYDAGMDLFDSFSLDAALNAATKNALLTSADRDANSTTTDAATSNSAYSKQITTLLGNDEEAFVLEPVDATFNKVTDKHRLKRKRRLLVDTVKNISGDDFKAQLTYDKDTLGRLEVGPYTKTLLKMRETGSFDKLWNSPCTPFLSSVLSSLYGQVLKNPPALTKEEYMRQVGSEELEMIRAGEEDSTYSVINADPRVSAELPPIQDNASASMAPDALSELIEGDIVPMESTTAIAGGSGASTPRKVKRPSSFRRTPSSRSSATDDSASTLSMRWTRKSHQLLNQIKNKLKTSDEVTFKALVKGNDRRTVAHKFYSLLELQKWNTIVVQQGSPFSDIHISRPDGVEVTKL